MRKGKQTKKGKGKEKEGGAQGSAPKEKQTKKMEKKLCPRIVKRGGEQEEGKLEEQKQLEEERLLKKEQEKLDREKKKVEKVFEIDKNQKKEKEEKEKKEKEKKEKEKEKEKEKKETQQPETPAPAATKLVGFDRARRILDGQFSSDDEEQTQKLRKFTFLLGLLRSALFTAYAIFLTGHLPFAPASDH